jgi:imidazolonepropionase-like amidohydrolase
MRVVRFEWGRTGLAILALAMGGTAQASEAPNDAWTVVKVGRLIDPASSQVLNGWSLVIHEGKVTAAGIGAAPPAAAKDVKVVDLTHATVLPGLIDVHVHMTSRSEKQEAAHEEVSIPRTAINGVSNAKKTLLAGFTTVRNVGAPDFTDVALRDAINDGDVEGPRMLVSGPPIGATGGHADHNRRPAEDNDRGDGVADGPWAVRAMVRRDMKYGADLIKVMVTGGVLSHGDSVGGQQFTQEEMDAAVAEAHMWGRKVAVHAHGADGIKTALRAGADSIEHASFIDDEGIALAKAKGAYLDMDIYNDAYILSEGARVGIEPASLDKERQVGQIQRDNFRKAWKAGVKMAFATDAGVYPHGDNAKQFAWMVKYGMTPMEAIRAATTSGADLMGLAGKAGCLQVGCYADVIAVDADPLADVSALEHVRFVMKDGVVYKE